LPLCEPAPPFWILSLRNSAGNITALERETAAELLIEADAILGDGLPLAYASEQDAVQIAVTMMRKRPELEIGVACSDPSFPAFSAGRPRYDRCRLRRVLHERHQHRKS
jgi:hypothetical protein